MSPSGHRERIDGWKAIAAFLRRDERTVMRWEIARALPIHRFPGEGKASVFAYRSELDAWIVGVERAAAEPAAPAPLSAASDHPPASIAQIPVVRPAPAWGGRILVVALAVMAVTLLWRDGDVPGKLPSQPYRTEQTDPATQAIYLQARFYANSRNPIELQKAVVAYGAAIARDPRYAPAYAGLADCFLLLRQYSTLPDSEAFPRAEAAADQALALNPGSSAAQRDRAFVLFWWHGDRNGGLAAFRAAITLDGTDAQTHHWYATALAAGNDHRAALAEIDEARRIDPNSPAILANRGLILFQAGRLSEAQGALTELIANVPMQMAAHAWLSEVLLARGDAAGFLRERLVAARLRGDSVSERIYRPGQAELARAGPAAMLGAVAGRAERAFAKGQLDAYGVAQLEAMAGNGKRARALYEIARDRREVGAIAAPADRWLRAVGIDVAPASVSNG